MPRQWGTWTMWFGNPSGRDQNKVRSPAIAAGLSASTLLLIGLWTPAWGKEASNSPSKERAKAAVIQQLPEDAAVRFGRYEDQIIRCFEENRFQEERVLRAEYAAFLTKVFGKDDWHTQTQRLYHASSERVCKLKPADQTAIATARESGREGLRLRARRDHRGALLAFEKAFDAYKRLLGNEDVWCIATRVRMAETQQSSGKLKDAKLLWNEVLPSIKKLYGEHSPCYAQPLQSLGVCNLGLGVHAEAESQLRGSLEIQQKANGVDSYEAAISRYHLASLHNERREFDKAEAEARKVIAVVARMLPERHKECILIYCQLGKSCCEQGKYADAIEGCSRAMELMETFHAVPPVDVHAGVLDNYASSLKELNRGDEARPYEKKAEALRAQQARKEPADRASQPK